MTGSTEVSTEKIFPLVPRTMEELLKLSKYLAASELVPKDFQNKDANCFVAIQWGMEIGLMPIQALQSIAVINGRPSLWGDAGLALVYGSGLVESFKEEITAEGTTCTTKRKGNPEATVRTFTKEDAIKADLWGKGTYAKYPKRMLQMRARWWALRDAYTDVLRGVAGAEELVDTEIDVTPAAAAVEQPKAKSDAGKIVDAEVVTPTPTPAATPEPTTQAPAAANQASAAATGAMGEGQIRIIRAKMKNAALTDADLVAKFGNLEELKFAQFQEIQDWIASRSKATAG